MSNHQHAPSPFAPPSSTGGAPPVASSSEPVWAPPSEPSGPPPYLAGPSGFGPPPYAPQSVGGSGAAAVLGPPGRGRQVSCGRALQVVLGVDVERIAALVIGKARPCSQRSASFAIQVEHFLLLVVGSESAVELELDAKPPCRFFHSEIGQRGVDLGANLGLRHARHVDNEQRSVLAVLIAQHRLTDQAVLRLDHGAHHSR